IKRCPCEYPNIILGFAQTGNVKYPLLPRSKCGTIEFLSNVAKRVAKCYSENCAYADHFDEVVDMIDLGH
ncbi:hypothetical protein N8787_05525, partial [Opitutaceae bacterium]|nr:hypothetical protein [Opitutaceae bacterium]